MDFVKYLDAKLQAKNQRLVSQLEPGIEQVVSAAGQDRSMHVFLLQDLGKVFKARSVSVLKYVANGFDFVGELRTVIGTPTQQRQISIQGHELRQHTSQHLKYMVSTKPDSVSTQEAVAKLTKDEVSSGRLTQLTDLPDKNRVSAK